MDAVSVMQYNSHGERVDHHDTRSLPPASNNNNLKQNIDELDTLLYDLNNASKVRDGSLHRDYTSDGPGGPNKHLTSHSYSEHSYHTSSSSAGKPPSPSMGRRPLPLSSPSSVRRASPQRQLGGETTTSYKYTYSSSRDQDQQHTYTSSYPPPNTTPSVPMPVPPTPPERTSIPPPTSSYPTTPAPPPTTNGSGPSGVSYYTKYHSTHTHSSQHGGSGPPASFPSRPSPSPAHPANSTQTPPKRVDQLMTELSEFDSSIQDTRFVEPAEPVQQHRRIDPEPYRPYREPSPERKKPQASTPGPAVYYPPGEMFTSSSSKRMEGGGGGGQAKAEYSYKSKEKSKISEGEGKQGAAVVPICLPLCCAAPCVIM